MLAHRAFHERLLFDGIGRYRMQYSAIGGLVFTALFLFAWLLLDWPEYFHYKARARYNKRRKCLHTDPNRAIFYASEAEKNCHEHYHREHEKAYWLIYIVITSFTFIAAATAAYYAGGAYWQARRQADAAEAANSPFIYALDPAFLKQNDNFFLYLKWINNGTSPAVDVSIKSSCALTIKQIDKISEAIYAKAIADVSIFGPKQASSGTACTQVPLTEALANLINNQKVFFYLGGRVCYRAYGSKAWHMTENFSRITNITILTNGITAGGNVVGSQNCVDTGCTDFASACKDQRSESP